eukprot:TRINITY_DN7597_c0_g1_i1.p1 TRINITY_DN7597_c0_g1~~TRINITY_DN7597_c0_g1_i1.p1  ORF type:complete len:351 (+),score=88.79 TRINITY_DN7597_c0_g1_i1:42-1094(+)
MKLKAQICTVDRNVPGGANCRNTKFVTGCCSLGRKNLKERDSFLLVSTTSNRTGHMYKINKDNVQKVFGKFIREGKVTFRFNEPPHDVSLKADPSALESFLVAFKATGMASMSSDPKEKDALLRLPTLTPAKPSDLSRPKEKLMIFDKKDYPFTKGFPSSVKLLIINKINLRRIDSRILKLRHLVSLNLDSCSLTQLPPIWDRLLYLASLYLPNNKLDSLPPEFCQGSLAKSLQILDLRNNIFKKLPRYFCNFKVLHTLKIDNNQLFELPPSIGKMESLQHLSASNNRMAFFPGSAFFYEDGLFGLVRELHGLGPSHDPPPATRHRHDFPNSPPSLCSRYPLRSQKSSFP